MEAKPVRQRPPPAYPSRREMLATTASFVLVGLTGIAFTGEKAEGELMTVAPIFEHGEGRGATGCVVITPPVFMSEEEGMQILREEFTKYDIHLKAGLPLPGVRIAARHRQYQVVDEGGGKIGLKESIVEVPEGGRPLHIDGIDSNKKIAVEFVSRNDYFPLGGLSDGITAQDYELRQVAGQLAERVKKNGKGRFFVGVFYDPIANSPTADGAQDGSKGLLRQQAKDFVAWLKEQKAIQ